MIGVPMHATRVLPSSVEMPSYIEAGADWVIWIFALHVGLYGKPPLPPRQVRIPSLQRR